MRRHPANRLATAWLGIALSTAGAVACLVGAYRGMRAVMIESGGFCASGGPYEIASPCDSNTLILLMGSIWLGLLFVAIRAAFNGWIGAPGLGLFPTLGVLFAVLGYNFIDLGFNPPAGMQSTWGWIVCGILFWLMAGGFMVPLVWDIWDWIRRGGKPDPPAFSSSTLATVLRAPTGQAEPAAPIEPRPDVTPSRLVIPTDPEEPPR